MNIGEPSSKPKYSIQAIAVSTVMEKFDYYSYKQLKLSLTNIWERTFCIMGQQVLIRCKQAQINTYILVGIKVNNSFY